MELIATEVQAQLKHSDHILVPITDLESSRDLIRVAARLARAAERETDVLAFTIVTEAPSGRDCLLEEGDSAAAGVQATLTGETEGVSFVTARLVARDAARCVKALAEQMKVPLILLNWSGTPLYRGFEADLARQMLETAPTDVILLRARDLAGFQRVLVPVDAGADVGLRIDLARRLTAGTAGAEVVVLRIVNPITGVDYSIEEVATEDLIRDELGTTAESVHARVVEAPDIVEGIVDEAANGYDLVLVGPSEQPLWRDWLFGSIPEQTAHRLPCSVLLAQEASPSPADWLRRLGRRIPLHLL